MVNYNKSGTCTITRDTCNMDIHIGLHGCAVCTISKEYNKVKEGLKQIQPQTKQIIQPQTKQIQQNIDPVYINSEVLPVVYDPTEEYIQERPYCEIVVATVYVIIGIVIGLIVGKLIW